MRLNVIGSSPAWPNPGGAQSGYLIEENGKRLLLDCGPGVLGRLREAELWPDVDAIVITHFHLDHWGDIVPWVWGALHRGDGRARPELWVHPNGLSHLSAFADRFGGLPDMFHRAFEVSQYPADETITIAGFDLTAIQLPHYTLETYGFRVSSNGHTLAYSGDSGPTEGLTALAVNADLFVCEATLETGAADGALRGHLSVDEAVDAFESSGAQRLLLTHRPVELPVPPQYELAYDGLLLDVA